MNVQELIDKLNLIEDKTLTVGIIASDANYDIEILSVQHVSLAKDIEEDMNYINEDGIEVPINTLNMVLI